MGEAKRRGSFESRVQRAIKKNQDLKEHMAKLDQERPARPLALSSREAIYIASLLAMASVTRLGRHR